MKLLRLQNDFTLQMLMDVQHAVLMLIEVNYNEGRNTPLGVFCYYLPDCKPLWETL